MYQKNKIHAKDGRIKLFSPRISFSASQRERVVPQLDEQFSDPLDRPNPQEMSYPDIHGEKGVILHLLTIR